MSEPYAVPALDSPRPRPLVTVLLVLVALVVGAGLTFSGLLFAGWRQQPENRYAISVFFKSEVTSAQVNAVHATLARIRSTDGVHLETGEDAYQKFQQEFKDNPQLLSSTTADTMPQSFHLDTVSRDDFDCTLVAPIGTMAGVSLYAVTLYPRDGHPGAKIAC